LDGRDASAGGVDGDGGTLELEGDGSEPDGEDGKVCAGPGAHLTCLRVLLVNPSPGGSGGGGDEEELAREEVEAAAAEGPCPCPVGDSRSGDEARRGASTRIAGGGWSGAG